MPRWSTTSSDLDSLPGVPSTALPPQKRIVLGALISDIWITFTGAALCRYWTGIMLDRGSAAGSELYVDATVCPWWIEITSGSGPAKGSDVDSLLGVVDTLLPL